MSYAATDGVCAVIVTYRPDPEMLLGVVGATRRQVGGLVVVDNSGAGSCVSDVLGDAVIEALLLQAENVGLAAAQNAGIAWARSHGFGHVLMLDQDSHPADGMVKALLNALHGLSPHGRVAAVGPRFYDAREHHDAPFVRIGFPLNRKLRCHGGSGTVACDFLISSGTLIPMAVLDAVGNMDASLFIDNVDLEWSFRARSMGYTLHGVCEAVMHHHLGDARRKLPFGMRSIVVHSPLRLYYMMRNRVLLYSMPHTPAIWVAQDVPRLCVKLFLFGVIVGPRLRYLRCMLRGLWDGLHRRSGPAPAHLAAG